MTKSRDPRNDMAFKKIFSEDNIEKIKDFDGDYGIVKIFFK